MLGSIVSITAEQLADLLATPSPRRITEVHVHHTARPRLADWRGRSTVEAIRRYHVEDLGWSDIAQHLTVGADGSLWTGRRFDRAPASAVGYNGTAAEGPLMIEIVGNFDLGADKLEGSQEEAVYRTVALICTVLGLGTDRIRFHSEFNPAKTCPGSSLELRVFRDAVAKAMPGLRDDLPKRYRQSGAVARAVGRAAADALTEAEFELDCEGEGRAERGLFGWMPSDSDLALFERHVVNTTMGQLSGDGYARSSPGQLERLIAALETWCRAVVDDKGGTHGGLTKPTPRIVLFAHGGLVDEAGALRNVVLAQARWWLDNGVYPVFLVWETGLNEVFRGQGHPDGERGALDGLIEGVTGPLVGRPAWKRMKLNAHLCVAPELLPKEPGGLRQFADRLKDCVARLGEAAPEVHAVGHSAGAILLSEFLPLLAAPASPANASTTNGSGRPLPIQTLSLLAPAIRVDRFRETLEKLATKGGIKRFSLFTMKRQAELADSVKGLYRKSLLYYVRNACEADCAPLLGLQESIEANEALRTFLKVDEPGNRLVLSPTSGVGAIHAQSDAISHGDFDEDETTMNSVMRRILGIDGGGWLPFPRVPARARRAAADSEGSASNGRDEGARPATGKRIHALCIGINDYPSSPLHGCVADAKRWAEALSKRGARVMTLFNSDATKRGILLAWRRLCSEARRGDVVVIQYAGHGTHIPDTNGDESDGRDEAWVAHDYERGGLLIDDEIGGLIDQHVAKGFTQVIITDCCHSGSGTRARNGLPTKDGSRFLPLDDDSPAVEAYFARAQAWAEEFGVREQDSLGPEIHFAACQDRQSAYETKGRGEFTEAATTALGQLPLDASYEDWSDAIQRAFTGNGRQTPNFRARPVNANLPVLTPKTRKPSQV